MGSVNNHHFMPHRFRDSSLCFLAQVRFPHVVSDQRDFNPGSAVLAWLWPGLGHIALGQKRRGGLIMFGVLFLVLLGLLVGGIESIDRQNDPLWFLAQMFCGPMAFGIDYLTQNVMANLPDERQMRAIGLGRANEMGTLFVALAGLMNLVVILDVLFHKPLVASDAAAQTPARRKEDAA